MKRIHDIKRVQVIHEKDSRHRASEALDKVSVHKMFTNEGGCKLLSNGLE